MGAAVPVISILSTVLGTAFSAYGAMQQGKAAAAQAEYQAAVGRNNAILAQRAADDARLRGEEAARRRAVETRQLSGRQRAVLAANGVLVDQGSALDLTSDTAEIGKLDELTIRSNAEREALGYEAQGMNFNASAQLNDMRADNARSSAMGSAFGTVLTGATSVASKWYQYRKEGWDPFGSGGGGGNFSVGLG
jgi:multidrug efflux pump subunit AcrA (membrane-fusion protein)